MTKIQENAQSLKNFRPEVFAVEAKKAISNNKLPPVHLWNPEFCGDIDMHIKRDGSWNYMGTPITRYRMVKLFSTILRQDNGDFFLVTPVEKVGIRVDDAPFVAVEVEKSGNNMIFRTNVDDYVKADKDHPIHVDINEETGEPSPYIRVRGNLDALISRSVYYELVGYAFEFDGKIGIKSGGVFFPLDGE